MELRVKNEQHAKWFGVPGNETVVKPIKIEKCFNVVPKEVLTVKWKHFNKCSYLY